MTKAFPLSSAGLILMLSTMAYGAEPPAHVRYPILPTQTAAASSPLSKVELSLATIAQLQSAQNYQVRDGAGQVMPARVVSALQPIHEQLIPLRAYHWPAQPPLTRAAAASLELQLNQDHAHAWVTWPDRLLEKTSALHADQSADQTWLLALPDMARYQGKLANRLTLTWPSSALSIQASLEGSQDLINWYAVGASSLLDTGQISSGGVQLKQSNIDVNQTYRYWRLALSAPLSLTQAAIALRDPVQPVMQKQAVIFQKSDSAGQSDRWLLSLPTAVAVSGIQFDLPLNQVWSLALSTRQPNVAQQGSEWQTQRQQTLSHWQNPPQGEPAVNDTLWIDPTNQTTTTAREWQLKAVGPLAPQLSATLIGPSQILYFVAQGQAPYYLEINRPITADGVMADALTLPQVLPSTQTATLGTMQQIAAPTPWKTYGLWAVLIVAVGLLAVAALRLVRGLDEHHV